MTQSELEEKAEKIKTFDEWDNIYLCCPNYSLLEAKALDGMLETAQTKNQLGILIAYLNIVIRLYSDPSYTMDKNPDYPIDRVKEIRNIAKSKLGNS